MSHLSMHVAYKITPKTANIIHTCVREVHTHAHIYTCCGAFPSIVIDKTERERICYILFVRNYY